MASDAAATALRPRQRWLLIGPPIVLLFAKGANSLVQLGLAEPAPRPVVSVLIIGLAALSIVAALALLSGRRLGWLLSMVVIGSALAGELVLWWIGAPDYVAMALLALCAFLVTSPELRAAYLGRRDRDQD